MLYLAKSGHPGGSLSAVEAIVALYFHHMNHNPKNPKDPNRDRFVLSKGHAAPTLYAALAECGYFDVKELDSSSDKSIACYKDILCVRISQVLKHQQGLLVMDFRLQTG